MDENLYEGICFGGPLHGEIAISRYPEGFLLIHKQSNKCWIYDWKSDSGCFHARDEKSMPVLTEGPKNRYRAAEEPYYDVIAASWVIPDGD